MGPPLGLGLFGVAGIARGGSWGWLATIVRVLNLLTRLDKLDKCLGDYAAVNLLEVLQGVFIVIHNLLCFSNSERDHFNRAIREVFAVGIMFIQGLFGSRGGGCFALAAPYPTGR